MVPNILLQVEISFGFTVRCSKYTKVNVVIFLFWQTKTKPLPNPRRLTKVVDGLMGTREKETY